MADIQLTHLSLNMDELRQDEYDTDVIMAHGNVSAHKLILIASCSYFKMFFVKMKETNSGHVTFDWCSKEAIKLN
uniref:BTB domain-containing protein n=1 Tax=Strigamia maritima TaxID=126957 RepID=T1ITG5_STRMM